MKTVGLILTAGILVFLNSCHKAKNTDCSAIACPPEIVHGMINEGPDCYCRCVRGWIGTHCDQRDTSFYTTFRFGTDTLDLKLVRTNSYYLSSTQQEGFTWIFFEFADSLPVNSQIDSVIFTNQPLLGLPDDTTGFPICITDSTCVHLDVLLHRGDSAIALSGLLTRDTVVNNILDIGGTFKANLTTSTGDSFFIRDGKYFIPLIK